MALPLVVNALQTKIFRPGDDLAQFISLSVPKELIKEKIVVAVTSKIVSLAEHRLEPKAKIDKESLVKREADLFLGEIGYGCFLTIKDGLLIPSSGIDESNSESGDYILYPKDVFGSAQKLWQDLQKLWQLKEFGILLTDSHTTPLRRGVTGVALSYAGFRGVKNMVGSQDLFGRELKMTQINYADGLAATAVMMMGEGAEARPLAVIENAAIEFCARVDRSEISIPAEQDLYFPLFTSFQIAES